MPKSWKLYYKDASGNWQPVTGVDSPSANGGNPYGTVKGSPNTVYFDPVTTNSMKLEVVLPDDNSTGIFEWQLD